MGFPSPDQLNCDNQSFFEGLHPLSSGPKAFFNSVPSFERDIFKNCPISSLKRVLSSELLETASSLEGMPISEVIPKGLPEATEVVEEAEKV